MRFKQFQQILKSFSNRQFIKRPEINDFFNLIDNMLRLVLQISREDSFFREGACLLHRLYSQECKLIMEREFSPGQLAQVTSQCNAILDHNTYFDAYSTLSQRPNVLPAQLMKRVYEMDKEQGFSGSLCPAERILRQWFTAESKLVGGGFDTLLPVRLFRVFRGNAGSTAASFQKQMENCISEVFGFFEWLLFSSDPFHYKVAQDIVLSEEATGAATLQQANPEDPGAASKQMCWTQFTARVLATVQRIKRHKDHELHKALFPAPPPKPVPLPLQTPKLNLTQQLQQQGSTSANPIDLEQFSAAPNPTPACEWHSRLSQLEAEFRQARAPEHHEARNKLFQQVVFFVNQKEKWGAGSAETTLHLNKLMAEHLTENQRSVVRKHLNSTFATPTS